MQKMIGLLLICLSLFISLGFSHTEVPKHVCIHDEIEKLVDLNEGSVSHQQLKGLNSRTGENGKRIIEEAFPGEDQFETLRVHIQTNNLDGDTQYSCYQNGDVVDNARSSTGQFTCQQADILDAGKRDYLLNQMLKAAVDKLKAFKVIPTVDGKTRTVNGLDTCAGTVQIPPTLQTNGVDGDFILLVTARPIPPAGYPNPTPGAGRTLATATTCQTNSIGRPIVGWANFDPSAIDQNDKQAMALQIGVAIHEISHALGFSYGTFSSGNRFKKIVGGQYVDMPANEVVEETSTGSGKFQLITPKLLEIASDHFGCPTLSGVLLEDGGGPGTEKSHWEKSILFSEYMTGTASADPVFSKMTMAVFEDSNWYRGNYSMVDALGFGRNQGCAFATQGCPAWPSTGGYSCSSQLEKSCTPDYLSYGICNSAGSTLLPCAYFQPQTLCTFEYAANETDPLSKTANELISAGEEYTRTSRCFESSLNKVIKISELVPIPGVSTQRCYKTACAGPTKLKIAVGGFHYDCDYTKGGEVKIHLYGGSITCPRKMADVVCSNVYTDDPDWPVFESVNPAKAKPSATITVTGKNFAKTAKMEVFLEEQCTNVTVISDTVLTANVANQSAYYNPRFLNILGEEKIPIAIRDAAGRSVVKDDAFVVQVEFNLQYLEALWGWAMKNPGWAALAVAILVIPCICFCFCCYKKCKKDKKPKRGQFAHNYDTYDDKYYYDEDPEATQATTRSMNRGRGNYDN